LKHDSSLPLTLVLVAMLLVSATLRLLYPGERPSAYFIGPRAVLEGCGNRLPSQGSSLELCGL